MNHHTKEAMPFIGRRLVFIYSESPGGVLYTLLKVVSVSSICKIERLKDLDNIFQDYREWIARGPYMYLIGRDPDVPDEAYAAIITAYSMDDQCAHKQERIDVTDQDFCRAKDCIDEIGIPCDNGRLCFGFSSPLCIYSMGQRDKGYLRGKLDFENAYSISCDRVEVFPQYISGPTGFRSEMCGLANHMVGCCLRKSMVVVMSRSIVHSSKGKPKEVCRTRRFRESEIGLFPTPYIHAWESICTSHARRPAPLLRDTPTLLDIKGSSPEDIKDMNHSSRMPPSVVIGGHSRKENGKWYTYGITLPERDPAPLDIRNEDDSWARKLLSMPPTCTPSGV